MKYLLLILCLATSAFSQAQDSLVYYFFNGKTVQDPARAETRMVLYPKISGWQMESRYTASGQLSSTGFYLDKLLKQPEGSFAYYYKNGQQSSARIYRNGKLNGWCLYWAENGRLTDSVYYRDGRRTGYSRIFNSKGELTTCYELNEEGSGRMYEYWSPDSLRGRGALVNGRREGPWQYYDRDGSGYWDVSYTRDSITQVNCFHNDGKPKDSCVFERTAMPPGGLRSWTNYLSRTLNGLGYPDKATSKKYADRLFGTVYVKFIVEKDGSLSNMEILNPLNEVADQHVIRLMQNGGLWQPAVMMNKPVRMSFMQPVTFREYE